MVTLYLPLGKLFKLNFPETSVDAPNSSPPSELVIGINPKLRKTIQDDRIYPEGRSTQGRPGTRPKRKR